MVMKHSAVAVENLTVLRGGQPALREVSFSAEAGSLTTIIGPNGAGKSTLLRTLCGDLEPSRGSIRLHDQALDRLSPRALAQQRAYLPQHSEVRFGLSAREIVTLGLSPHRTLQQAQLHERVDAALAAVDAAHLAHRRYPSLSGGEQQRIQLARVIAQVWPSAGKARGLLLLDEPLAALDMAHQHSTMQLARRLARQGLTVICVLHDLNLAAQYADRLALLDRGRLLACDRPDQVLTTERIRSVFGMEVEVTVYSHDGRLLVLPLDTAVIAGPTD